MTFCSFFLHFEFHFCIHKVDFFVPPISIFFYFSLIIISNSFSFLFFLFVFVASFSPPFQIECISILFLHISFHFIGCFSWHVCLNYYPKSINRRLFVITVFIALSFWFIERNFDRTSLSLKLTPIRFGSTFRQSIEQIIGIVLQFQHCSFCFAILLHSCEVPS